MNKKEPYWNYRIIEFRPQHGNPYRAIHEVHYSASGQFTYAASPADILWEIGEEEDTPGQILDRMREALAKPVLSATRWPQEVKESDD